MMWKEGMTMKKLNRIRLINWQGFFDDTIDVEGSTLIVGDNGSGKSSLLDALYFILSGGSTKAFNSAASFKSKRSLETYIRGRTGEISHPNLRPDASLVSHICLQFHDDVNKTDFCIGTVLELDPSGLTRHFYRLMGNFPEDMFQGTDDNAKQVLDYSSMKKKLEHVHNIHIDDLGTTGKDFKRLLKSILSLEDEKYYELLPKAMAFQPIDDINEFAYDFLIPEKKVELGRMREILKTYKEIRRSIDEDNAKKMDLIPIIEQGRKYQDDERRSRLLNALSCSLAIQEGEGKIHENENRIQSDKVMVETLSKKKNALQESLERVNRSIFEIEQGEAYQRMQKIDELLKKAKEDKLETQKKVNRLDDDVRKEQEILDCLSLHVDLKEALEKRDSALLSERLSEEKRLLREKKDALYSAKSAKNAQYNNTNDKLGDINLELEELKKGIQSLPDNARLLIDVLKERMPEANPIPLCQLVDVTDEEWRDALEGYLGDRRFDLILPKELYPDAASIYEELKARGKVHGIGLVDIEKLDLLGDIILVEDSLATKILCEDKTARKYVDFLLGQVCCVETMEDRNGREKAITKDVFVYEDKALRKVNGSEYRIPYIGPKSLELRLAQLEKEKEEFESASRTLYAEIQNLEYLTEKAQESKNEMLLITQNAWDAFASLEQKCRELQEELDELKMNDTMIPELERHRQEKERLTQESEECVSRITTLNAEIERLPKDNESIRQGIEENRKRLLLLMDSGLTRNELDAFQKDNPGDRKAVTKKLGEIQAEMNELDRSLSNLMTSYIIKFHFDSTGQVESLDDFFKEYNLVVNRNLEQFSMREKESRKEVTDLFQNDYIQKMRANIKEAQRRVKELNAVLQKRPFGSAGDIYQFELARSKDKEFGEIFDVFITEEDFNPEGLFSEGLTDEHLRVMSDLLKRLTSQADESDEEFYKRVGNYLDYRKFMSYDIIIRNAEGKRYRFSEIFREKSGGETQTPFYVIIAASFDQLFNSNYGPSSKGCIVLLDEAFEKMDEAHIESMMQYFKELHIQPFIAVPTQHGRTIMPYVDTNIGLYKANDRIVIYSLDKEEL